MLLVFDFDGTLMDTLRDLAEAASDLAEAYGGARLTEAATAAMIGDGAPVFVSKILATVGIEIPPPDALARYLDFYERRVFDHTRPYPGVLPMLEAVAPVHRLALLTNKPEASTRVLMRHTSMDRFFGPCIFGDSDGVARKPDPAGLHALMAQTGCGPADTLMVGDSIMDLEAARAAGAAVCLARYGFGFRRIPVDRIESGDWVIDRPMDLVALLGASGSTSPRSPSLQPPASRDCP